MGKYALGTEMLFRIESLLQEYAKVDLSESFPNKNVE
jgi:hypothetical protein